MDSAQELLIEKEKIFFNGIQITREELEEKRKEIAQVKGMQLVEVAPGQYKTRLLG